APPGARDRRDGCRRPPRSGPGPRREGRRLPVRHGSRSPGRRGKGASPRGTAGRGCGGPRRRTRPRSGTVGAGVACFGVVIEFSDEGEPMAVRVGINGFGRIGRSFTRALLARGADAGVELVAVNDPMGDSQTLAFLLKHDSVGGTLANDIAGTEDGISID